MNNSKSKKRNLIILLAFLVAIAIIVYLIKPTIIKKSKTKWKVELEEKISSIKNFTRKRIQEKQDSLFEVKQLVENHLKIKGLTQNELINFICQNKFNKFSINISSKLNKEYAWSQKVFLKPDIDLFKTQNNKTLFISSDLITFLFVQDTLNTPSAVFTIQIALPIEKDYTLENKYFDKISFTDELKSKFDTEVEIEYDTKKITQTDGRFFSFYIKNNLNKNIGTVSVKKPTLDLQLSKLTFQINSIEFILLIVILLLIFPILFENIKNIKFKLFRITVYLLYLGALRTLLFISGLVSNNFDSQLTNPAYFSSVFAFGIVKSPLELFITCLFIVAIILVAYKEIIEFIRKDKNPGTLVTKLIWAFVVLFSLAAYFLLYRAFGASIRSTIYDSTLAYFNDEVLIPNATTSLMYANVLLIGFSFFLLSGILLLAILYYLKILKLRIDINQILIIFVVLQIIGFLFDLLQREPQGTTLIRAIFILLTLLLAYAIFIKQSGGIKYIIYSLFAASFLSIALMIHYNFNLEKESLKLYAADLNRPNENWLEFLVKESLLKSFSRKEAIAAYTNQHANYDAYAFKIWSKSALQKESFISELSIYDYNRKFLGGFGFRVNEIPPIEWSKLASSFDDIQIYSEQIPNTNAKVVRGIFPIKNHYALLGYLETSVIYDVTNFGFDEPPKFLSAPQVHKKLTIKTGQIKLLEFINGKLKNVVGDIRISLKDIQKLKTVKFSGNNEAWLNIKFNGESYLFYLSKRKINKQERILALGLKHEDFSFRLFDFFKTFFFHALLILGFMILYFIFSFQKGSKLVVGLRTKLLIAFLIISIIPLVLLAFYFRNLTEQKNRDAILYKLGKRAYRIETYVNSHATANSLELTEIFDRASIDLNINFTVYKNYSVFYSTESLFYEIGLIPSVINPQAFSKIKNLGTQDFVTQETIEKYKFNSFYYVANIWDKSYTINVNDAFNKILLPMSGNEVDAFLVGTYSIAVLLVIILSTILANQISKPIRRLTKATKSVASGDLNVKLTDKTKGEVKDLVDGFNYMVKELKLNQIQLAEVEREAAWKEMAKQVAHEIKNPLTPMKLATQQLIAAYKDKSDKFALIFEKVTSTIINQIETLGNIATEFSNFAKMPSLKIEETNLIGTIKEAINLFVDEKAKIIFESEFESVVILADEDQLKRTIINLIRNSLQANSTEVRISLELSENQYLLKVKDNGSGIPPNILDKVFEFNFTTKESGTGIGLSLAKKYLESINSSIEIERTGEKGTLIVIRFNKK